MATIRTSELPDVREIRRHYDQLSSLYARFWGEHIHHGYWRDDSIDDAAPVVAQERLVAELARRANIRHGAKVLDLGCGIGGSSSWLARHLGCSVVGITISPVQARLAESRVRRHGVGDRVRIVVGDMNSLHLTERFDVAWIVESSEHVRNKAALFRTLSTAINSSGVVAIGAWLSAESLDNRDRRAVNDVCRGMLCPNLGRMSEYVEWLEQAGFAVESADDITPNVARTWVHCTETAKRPAVRAILHFADSQTRRFVETFPIMTKAYEIGAMRYGMLVARKMRYFRRRPAMRSSAELQPASKG